MARFYAVFDHTLSLTGAGELGTTTDTNNFFNKLVIGVDSAEGSRLRSGLIASRSALSIDALADISSTYRDGAQGTIIPGDLYTSDGSTYVSWSKAGGGVYTSPSSTAWGVVTPADYRTRPTASITSTNALLTQRNNQVGVDYNTYIKATNAVTAVINAWGGLSYAGTSNNYSRTAHSVWHDADLTYFAFDDFTPGQPQSLSTVNTVSGVTTTTSTGNVMLSMSREWLNDFNPNGSAVIVATLRYATSSGGSFTGQNNIAASLSTTVAISALGTTPDPDIRTYTWNPGTLSKAVGNLIDGQSSDGVNLHYTVTYKDPVITTSEGTPTSIVRNTGGTATVNGTNLGGNSCYIKIGTA